MSPIAEPDVREQPSVLAFRLARRQFLAGERVKMQRLADELGVTRMTLHRWFGTRDHLLGEVLWSITEPTIKRARAETRLRGGRGIALAMRRFLEMISEAEFMRSFLQREPETALGILTTTRSPLQQRIVSVIAELLRVEVRDGHLEPSMDIDDLAYVIVRILEGFAYTDHIAGRQPDARKAQQALEALLR